MTKLMARCTPFVTMVCGARDDEEGQALVEYALLLALIAVVSIGILTALGQNVSHIFSKINNKL
jgi:pilus assembly protein Flp/PilA